MFYSATAASFLSLLLAIPSQADDQARFPSPKRVERDILGWTFEFDEQLLSGAEANVGQEAIDMLTSDLRRLKLLLPAERIAELQRIRIMVDLEFPVLQAMQYHPSAGWLRDNGYEPNMAKKVHIPRVKGYLSRNHSFHQPYVLLHELAHAYHDQILGFDNPVIKRAYDEAVKAGTYTRVLRSSGQRDRHYALTDHKEYFAEATEAYFGTNDFYPFVRAELKEHDPIGFEALEEVWLRRSAPKAKPESQPAAAPAASADN